MKMPRGVALLVLAIILGYAGAANAGTAWHVGDLTTYGQGLWGGVPGIDAGATLLVAKFDTVYAATGGVAVGSSSGFTMVFTDTQPVLDYLPAIGPYAPLNASTFDPFTTASGALGGDVLALELNVDFSDAGFLPGTSGLRFGDLVLTGFSPTTFPQLNGLTVRQFLGDVNTLLSGGSSIVSISDLSFASPTFPTPLLFGLTASFSSGTPSQFAQDHLEAPSAPAQAVPEPSTLVMSSILFGMFGVGWAYRQRQRARAAACAAFEARNPLIQRRISPRIERGGGKPTRVPMNCKALYYRNLR
jgi:hypothetical protein